MINRRSAMTQSVIATIALILSVAVTPAQAQQRSAMRVPRSVLQRYVGEWIYPDGNSIMVSLSGDTLFRETAGQRVPFVPLSETLFRLGPVFTAEFLTDEKGGITQILSDGAATEYRLRRKGSPPAAQPAPPPAVSVSRAVLERYAGVYEYVPGQMKRTDLRIVIRLRGDTLTTDAGGMEIALTPISATRFRVGSTSLFVEFVVDDAGVTQVLGSGFQQMLARLQPKR